MLLVSSLMALLLAVDDVVVRTQEPAIPEQMELQFLTRCGGHQLRLGGIGVPRRPAALTVLHLDQKPLALSPSAISFLSKPRSSYRLYTACGDGGSTFHMRLYRISGSEEREAEYTQYALDVRSDGTIKDLGEVSSNAENFWYN